MLQVKMLQGRGAEMSQVRLELATVLQVVLQVPRLNGKFVLFAHEVRRGRAEERTDKESVHFIRQ